MRYLILTAVLLFAVSANAQKFIVGVNAGATRSLNYKKVPGFLISEDIMKNNTDPAGNIRFGIRNKVTEYGCLVSLSRFSQQIDDQALPEQTEGPVIPHKEPFNGYTRFNFADMALSVQFYVNQHLLLGKFDLYGGLALGQGKFFARNGFVRSRLDLPATNPFETNKRQSANTFTTTVMAGCNYVITKNLSVNVEVNGNYIVPYSMKTDRFMHLYSLPVTAGIRYTLF